ncbi:MAG: sulfite exporter TauE/SafE family protein [Candidatus Omnitrophota bacterium]
MSLLVLGFIGILGGVAAGLFGIGGGAIFAPLLILLRGFDPHLAIGTSIAVVIPTSLIATIRHQQGGMVDWKTMILLVIFSMLGAWLGAGLSLKLDVILLKKLFAVFLVAVSVKLFFF